MRKGSKKSPLQRRTKEELEREMKMEAKRRLIKEQFYPSLKDTNYSVEETGMLLGAISSLIMAEAMEALHVIKMEEIQKKVVKKLTQEQEGKGSVELEKLMDVFKGHSLFEVRGHIESMKQVIEQMKIEEFQGRKLDSLVPLWEKYLH